MGCKIGSSMNLLVLLLVVISFVESSVGESVVKSNEFTKCKSELGVICGGVIHQYLFKGVKEVSKDCCSRLLTIGDVCHDLLTEVSLVFERLPAKQAKVIKRKSDQLWEHCKKIRDAPSSTGTDELKKCSNAIGEACGGSIYKNVFGVEKQVPEICCGFLISAGKDCHDFLIRVTIVYRHITEKKAKEAWQKKDKVWEQCKKSVDDSS